MSRSDKSSDLVELPSNTIELTGGCGLPVGDAGPPILWISWPLMSLTGYTSVIEISFNSKLARRIGLAMTGGRRGAGFLVTANTPLVCWRCNLAHLLNVQMDRTSVLLSSQRSTCKFSVLKAPQVDSLNAWLGVRGVTVEQKSSLAGTDYGPFLGDPDFYWQRWRYPNKSVPTSPRPCPRSAAR